VGGLTLRRRRIEHPAFRDNVRRGHVMRIMRDVWEKAVVVGEYEGCGVQSAKKRVVVSASVPNAVAGEASTECGSENDINASGIDLGSIGWFEKAPSIEG